MGLLGSVPGLFEESGHLAVAKGLGAFGRQVRWKKGLADYAASRVVDHWCTVLLLDPFSPAQEENEGELAAVLSDIDWVANLGVIFDVVRQAASVAPTLRVPGSNVPLGSGLRALTASMVAHTLIGCDLASKLSEEELDSVGDLIPNLPLAARWLEERVPDYASRASGIVWGGVLRGELTLAVTGGELSVALDPDFVLALLDTIPAEDAAEIIRAYVQEATADSVNALLGRLRQATEMTSSDATSWPVRLSALGLVYRERAERRGIAVEIEDLENAVNFYSRALEATPADSDDRLDRAMDLADALWDVRQRSNSQTETLVVVQEEIVRLRRDKDDPWWVQSVNLLGDAFRERAERHEDDARTEDFERALVAYREALHATPADSEYRDTFIIDLVNTLMRLPERSRVQLDELIALREELTQRLRQAGDPRWVQSASLLGDAYRERTERRGEDARAEDLERALAIYREALHASPAQGEHWLHCVLGLANALWLITDRSSEQIDELIELQLEIVATRRDNGDPGLPHSANLLGDAFRERAERREDDARTEDLERAVVAYREALHATPTGKYHDTFIIDLVNTLMRLPERSRVQLDELIALRQELTAKLRENGDSRLDDSLQLLGDAYCERAKRLGDETQAEDLTCAVAAYREALQATPAQGEQRLRRVIGLANALWLMADRSSEQLDQLIELELEIVATRRERRPADGAVGAAARRCRPSAGGASHRRGADRGF